MPLVGDVTESGQEGAFGCWLLDSRGCKNFSSSMYIFCTYVSVCSSLIKRKEESDILVCTL